MKGNLLKFTVWSLALTIGVAVVWMSGIHESFLQTRDSLPSIDAVPPIETSQTQKSTGERSGKVLIRFQKFEYGKEWNADFEITNDTTQPVMYVGSNQRDKLDYCTLAVKHEEPFPANHDGKIDNLGFNVNYACYYGKFLSLQTLQPGESVVLAVEDHTVRNMLTIKDPTFATKAQIGFEFFTGREKRREILWSDEITFPQDPYVK